MYGHEHVQGQPLMLLHYLHGDYLFCVCKPTLLCTNGQTLCRHEQALFVHRDSCYLHMTGTQLSCTYEQSFVHLHLYVEPSNLTITQQVDFF